MSGFDCLISESSSLLNGNKQTIKAWQVALTRSPSLIPSKIAQVTIENIAGNILGNVAGECSDAESG
jgi:hypothetical protein